MMSNRQQGRAAVNSSVAAGAPLKRRRISGISASFVEDAIVVMEMQTNSCTARTGQARCVESSQARAAVCMGACVQVGPVVMQPCSEKPGCCHRRFFFFSFFFCKKTEDDREDEQRGRGAAVADSIRHAGLQCKLLHGHRCGFYGWNTEAFLNSAAPALPAPHWRQRRRGGAGWRGFSSCDLSCLTAAVSIREMARWRPRPPTQESHYSF